MPSRISQMRNEGQQPMQYPQQSRNSMNESIQRTKQLMSSLKNMENPQEYLVQMISNNIPLFNLIKNGNLEQTAKNMAKEGGYDINEIISQLSQN